MLARKNGLGRIPLCPPLAAKFKLHRVLAILLQLWLDLLYLRLGVDDCFEQSLVLCIDSICFYLLISGTRGPWMILYFTNDLSCQFWLAVSVMNWVKSFMKFLILHTYLKVLQSGLLKIVPLITILPRLLFLLFLLKKHYPVCLMSLSVTQLNCLLLHILILTTVVIIIIILD